MIICILIVKNVNTFCVEERIKPVVVCIGTSKVIGDSLGAKVGDILMDEHPVIAHIYGNSEANVNGCNLNDYINLIKKNHKDNLIIAVDACVGNPSDVGKVFITEKGIRAGGALGKKFERLGDIGILGVVCEKGSDNFKNLTAVSEQFVDKIADKIAKKIVSLLFSLNFHK